MDDLLREAIADAKAVRETALENAKIALEEAFTPRLQSMLSKKIATEMEDAEIEDSEKEDSEERSMSEMDVEDEERDMPEEEGDDFEEMSHDAEETSHDAEETSHDAEEMSHDVEDEIAPEEGEDEVAPEEGEDEVAPEEGEEIEDEDDLDLESVLAELEKDLDDEDHFEEAEDKDEEDKVEENDVSSDIGKADNKVNPEANDSSKTGAQGPEGEGKDEPAGNELDDHQVVKEEEDKDDVDEDLDLDEVLKALSEEEEAEEEADKVDELKKEITETRNVVKFMRAKLNEVNLLNAKLLFSNKLFRAFGLNNDQKLKVVENFDRTTNLREVKLVYATLAESFKRPSKLSESVSKGSSSKPVASTKPANQEVLSEGAELKARFKKLANIL